MSILGIREARQLRAAATQLAEALTDGLSPGVLALDDAEALAAAAELHGVLGLFPVQTPNFARTVLTARARSLRALKFTLRVVDALEAARVPCVVLKGSASAAL